MNNYEQQASEPSAEFLELMDATDPKIVHELEVLEHNAVADHIIVNHAVYWMLSHADDPEAYAKALCSFELQSRSIATKLEANYDPERIDEIIGRYEERVEEFLYGEA